MASGSGIIECNKCAGMGMDDDYATCVGCGGNGCLCADCGDILEWCECDVG